MNEERLLILKMVANGKLTPDQGDRLIAALDGSAASASDRTVAADKAYDLLSRTAKDLQKGVQDLGTRAEGELRRAHEQLRRREASLREHVEGVAKTFRKKTPTSAKKDANAGGHRDDEIHIEVEDDDTAAERASQDEARRASARGEGDGGN